MELLNDIRYQYSIEHTSIIVDDENTATSERLDGKLDNILTLVILVLQNERNIQNGVFK